ncbi:MAG: hypothetical protein ACKOOD_04790 [Microbacteriaceae bacterium]
MPEFEKSRNHRDRKPREEAPARPDWQQRVDRPANPDKAKSPLIPNDIQPEDLEMGVRVQLKTLTAENAERVARHLAMVSILWDQDPQLAHRHAQAAADRAGRIAVVRETLAVTAYLVEDWALALREFLTHRRMTASNEHLAMMVDCERGLDRPKRALELGRSVDRASLSAEVRVNLAIACSGARLDLGETELALAELEIKELDPSKVFEFTPPLFWAYAETLSALGRDAEADKWSDLARRADAAIAAKFAPVEESLEVIEEIEIPKAADFVRRDGDGSRSGGFKRDGERPRTGGFKRDGDGPRSGGFKRDGDGPRSGGFKRDGDRPGPDSRPGGPRSSGPRSTGPRSSGPRPGGTRPGGSRPGGPRSGGSRPGGSRGR